MHKGGLSTVYISTAFSLVCASCIYTVLSGAANRHFSSLDVLPSVFYSLEHKTHARAHRDIKYTRAPIFFQHSSTQTHKMVWNIYIHLRSMHCCILLSPCYGGLCTCVYTCLLSSSDEIESRREVSGAQRNKSWWPIRCSISLSLAFVAAELNHIAHCSDALDAAAVTFHPLVGQNEIERDTYRNSPSANK